MLAPRIFERAVLERRLAWLGIVGLDPLHSPLSLEDVVALELVGSPGRSTESELAARRQWADSLLDALASTARRRCPSSPPGLAGGRSQAVQAARDRQHRRYRMVMAEQAGRASLHQAELEERLAGLRQAASHAYAGWEEERLAHQAELEALKAQLADSRGQLEAARAEAESLSSALSELEARRCALQRELDATHATRLFRYAAGPRRLYAALRRWLR